VLRARKAQEVEFTRGRIYKRSNLRSGGGCVRFAQRRARKPNDGLGTVPQGVWNRAARGIMLMSTPKVWRAAAFSPGPLYATRSRPNSGGNRRSGTSQVEFVFVSFCSQPRTPKFKR